MDQSPAIRFQMLIDALRRPLPDGFDWNMFLRGNCAMGLAVKIGITDWATTKCVAEAIGITDTEARRLFIPFGEYKYPDGSPVKYSDITPAMVADKLEEIERAK